MIHASEISGSLRRQLGGSSPWFMLADEFDAGMLPDTVTDPHQLVLREQRAAPGENCGPARLFAAVNDGTSFDSAQASEYSLRYWLTGDAIESPPTVIRLKRLPHTGCLVPANLAAADPQDGAFNAIRFDVEVDNGEKNSVIFSSQRPWVHPSVVRWDLRRLQSIASSLVFADRWIVSGSVITRHTGDMTGGRVKIGQSNYPLSLPGSESPCTVPGVSDPPNGFQCATFGGLYVAAAEPTTALIAFVPECSSSPRDCHFAELTPERPVIRLSWPWIGVTSILGMVAGVLFEAKRRKNYKLKLLFRDERTRMAVTILIAALLCTWVAEAMRWTPTFLPFHVRIRETLLPTVFALALVVFPAQVVPFIRLIGLLR